MFHLFAQDAPTGMADVLALPLLFFALGMGIWYGGLHFESRTEKAWLKWLALIPLAIGLIIGLQMTIQAMDYAYQSLMPTKRVLYSHYLALALPVGAILAIIGWHLYLKRTGAYHKH